jgi:hypothetical protein
MTGSNISKVLKMIYEALFSPSPDYELYNPSAILPHMIFYLSRYKQQSDCNAYL